MPHRLKTNQRHGKTQEQNGTDVAFTGDREQGGDDAPLASWHAPCLCMMPCAAYMGNVLVQD